MDMSREAAEVIALRALGWITAEDDLLSVFLGSSGASVDDLKTQAQDAVFLASILEFITMDDSWVMRFCDSNDIGYDQPWIASQLLQGQSRRHWT